MFPLAIVSMGVAVMAFWLAITEPVQVRHAVQIQGDVIATNFLAYRDAAVAYYNANPGASGVITSASLSTYYPHGLVPNGSWVARVNSGTLYVYSSTANTTTAASREALSKKTRNSLMVGVASGNTLTNITTGATGITLPTGVVPDGAFVIVGK